MGAVGASTTGFKQIAGSGRLGIYYRGVLVAQVNATDFGMVGQATSGALSSTTTITAGTGVIATTTLASTTTMTAGTGLTVTTGNEVNTAGDHLVTAGNVRLGAVSAFGTTEPTSAYVMKAGTAAAGAITTSSGIMTDGVKIQKIIADGTVSDVET